MSVQGGGPRFQISGGGGVPDPALDGGGGYLIQPWRGGSQVSDFLGGGSQVSDFQGGGGSLVSVKGKIFDTRFGLIHVQTGKKIFLSRDFPPPQ